MNPADFTWYAVYTRPPAERTLLEKLLAKGYLADLPRYRTEISYARRRQIDPRPRFARYLFAGADRNSMP